MAAVSSKSAPRPRHTMVVDCTCDLPQGWIESSGIVCCPPHPHRSSALPADHRDPEVHAGLQRCAHGRESHRSETIASPADQIRDLVPGRQGIDCGQGSCLTVTRNRSAIHDHASQASFAILDDCEPVLQQTGPDSPFASRVIDTRPLFLFAGQGAGALEAVRMRGGRCRRWRPCAGGWTSSPDTLTPA